MPAMTPQEILQIHKDYADQFSSMAQSGLLAAFGALSGSGIFDYHPAGISIKFPDFGNPNNVGALPPLPKDPVLPKDVTLKDTINIPNNNTGSAPVASYGAIPTYVQPSTPPGAPAFTATAPATPLVPVLPGAPAYLPMPGLTLPYPTVTIPTAPVITQPVFEGRRPNDITVPDAATLVGVYNTEMSGHRNLLPTFITGNADAFISKYAPEFALLRARINNAITAYTDPVTGGGVGIPINIENAIYARAGDKNNVEFQRAIDTSLDTLAKKGYTIPPGAALGSMRQARTAMGDAMVRSSTDIATKNVELEQQNFQFMLKLGEAVEEKMLDMVDKFMVLSLRMDEQAISSAKEMVATYVAAYNLNVMVYKALWEGYSADAAVYRDKIAALEATVRVYESQIKAELAKTEVNTAMVNVLRAVADVNQSLANSYKTQVEAALAPLEVAKIQVAIYEANARAYSAVVSAYEAQWRGYTAQVEGELGKFKAYEASVQGYVAQVQGYRSIVEAYTAQVTAAADTNKAISATNESKVHVYTAQANAAIEVFRGQVAGFSAESDAIIKQANIEVEVWRTRANLIFQEFNVAVQQMFEYAREQMNLFRGQMEAAINAANGLAHASQVAGNLAGQAMGGLTTFAGILESIEG
jgi:hypothetical protein